MNQVVAGLDQHIATTGAEFLVRGPRFVSSSINAVLDSERGRWHVFACWALGATTRVVCQRCGDPNILPYMHIYLAFLLSLEGVSGRLNLVGVYVYWKMLALFLNGLGGSALAENDIEDPGFPQVFSGTRRQLPEDSLICGSIWSSYLPPGFFDGQLENDERNQELSIHLDIRKEWCLYIGRNLSGLIYNAQTKEFTPAVIEEGEAEEKGEAGHR
jgi:hypothetical protein